MGPSTSLLVFALSFLVVIFHSSCEDTNFKEIHLGDHSSLLSLNRFTPCRLDGYIFSCDRLRVASLSRWKISSYSTTFRVNLTPSVLIPEMLYSQIEVCSHRNSSLGLCQCEKDEWQSFQTGLWSTSMSPYDDRYIDVKFNCEVTGFITVSIKEEHHQWRFILLVFGFILLLLVPVISNWAPFYYISSISGVFLVVLILLLQYFSMLVDPILVNFGIREEMHNLVAIVVLVAIVLVGAALGYWIVQKFLISEDGAVDVGVAEFAKRAIRIVATTFIVMSSSDTSLAMAALASSWAICLISSFKWQGSTPTKHLHPGNNSLWSRSAEHTSFASSDCLIKGLVISPSVKEPSHKQEQDYYSTFHKVPNRKCYSKVEYEDFTSGSTRDALTELASSHDFANWIIENASRIQLLPADSPDYSTESESEASEEAVAEGGGGLNLFKWY